MLRFIRNGGVISHPYERKEERQEEESKAQTTVRLDILMTLFRGKYLSISSRVDSKYLFSLSLREAISMKP